MCGITGFFNKTDVWADGGAKRVLTAMTAALRHRGPDSSGYWIDSIRNAALGHARLAIVDLSPGGHQPMVSHDGRYVITFNGEIYNHLDLRGELEKRGCQFHTKSDTETLVEAIAYWGPVKACTHLCGMFAFALLDRETCSLWLARDRLGKKPLYVHRDNRGGILFASELKAFMQFPGFRPELDTEALAHFFRYSYLADHVSIFRSVHKVMPGTLLEVTRGETREHSYWSLPDVVAAQTSDRIERVEDAEELLLASLRDATSRRMLSDVPVGAFLSGGVDSCLVVSLMQEASISRVKTFSIGFRDSSFDEAPVARAAARHLGTEHTEFYVDDAAARNIVPALPFIYDEPFADASQIPTTLLARMARTEVTVALTGDGGDESFGGYLRYRNQDGWLASIYRAPRPVRHALASTASAIPAPFWDRAAMLVPAGRRPRLLSSKVAKVARAIDEDDPVERNKSYLSFWRPAEILSDVKVREEDPYTCPARLQGIASETMQYWETRHYLPGDLLTKIDRAAMAASLEARSPLLDHRVVELAWRMPPAMKASAIETKRILRRLLRRYVPDDIVSLPKQGFSAPVGAWMKGGLRDWSEALISDGKARIGDIINWSGIDRSWTAHLAGRNGEAEKLWIVMMFCAWHEAWMHSPVVSPESGVAFFRHVPDAEQGCWSAP